MNRCSQIKVLHVHTYSNHEVVGRKETKEETHEKLKKPSFLVSLTPFLFSSPWSSHLPSAITAAHHHIIFPITSQLPQTESSALWQIITIELVRDMYSQMSKVNLFLSSSPHSHGTCSQQNEKQSSYIPNIAFSGYGSANREISFISGQKCFLYNAGPQFLALWTFSLQITGLLAKDHLDSSSPKSQVPTTDSQS